MSFLKFLFYIVAAYLVIRFINRIFSTKQTPAQGRKPVKQNFSSSENPDQPKYKIEADTVDYEIIEEEKDEK